MMGPGSAQMEGLGGSSGKESDLQGQGVSLSPQISQLSLHIPAGWVTISPDVVCVPHLPRGVIILKQED